MLVSSVVSSAKTSAIVVAGGPDTLLRFGGRTTLDRTIELLTRADHQVIAVVCADALLSKVSLETQQRDRLKAIASSDHQTLADLLSEASREVLLVEGNIVFDTRLIDEAAAFEGTVALVDSAPQLSERERPVIGSVGGVGGASFAGILRLPRATAREAALSGTLFDLAALAESLNDRRDADIDELPHYSAALRRALRPFWLQVSDSSDVRAARRAMVSAGGKGHQEWSVVVFNRPIETFLSYYVSDWRVTPNQITLLSNVTAFAATALFALGHWWSALALVAVTVILDGLDGRQARIQIKTSRLGELEHIFDAISEVTWIVAMAWFLSDGFADLRYLYASVGWLAAYGVDNVSYTFYRLRSGKMIDEASFIDMAIRSVGARRNTNFAYLAIGMALGYPMESFWFIVGWTALTGIAHWSRVAMLLSGNGVHSGEAR